MLRRQDKEKIVKDLTKEFESAKSVIFSDYKGMKVNELRELRKELRNESISYDVIKKSLIQIVLNNLKIDANVNDYKGPIAVSISKVDEVMPAKIIAKMAKKNESLDLVAGVLEARYLNQDEVKKLAKMPDKDELLGKLVGTINAPLSGFVQVLNGVQTQFVGVLGQIRDSRQ